MSPVVSVIIPAYNRRDTIGRALASALAQEGPTIEVLVIDDCSTDGTAEAAAALGDPRIHVIRHDRNRGAAAARNTGVAQARGRLIAFLDSDDEWLPGKLAAQVAALDAAPAGSDLCFTGLYLLQLDQNRTSEKRHHAPSDWVQSLMHGCDLSPGTVLLGRRAAFDRIGPQDESLRRLEDWDWLLRYALAGGGVVLLDALYARVYCRQGRLSRDNVVALRRFLAKHDAVFRRLDPGIRRRIVTDRWLDVAVTCAYAGDVGEMVRSLLRALRGNPLYWARNAAYVLRCYWRRGG